MRRLTIIVATLVLLTGCWPINTTEPEKAFTYWAGYKPTGDFNIMNGEYHQTPHFTTEYEAYLKLKPPSEWWGKLVEQRQLEPDLEDWTKRSDAPSWFNPFENTQRYCKDGTFGNSRYFLDTLTGECYIYETVGM